MRSAHRVCEPEAPSALLPIRVPQSSHHPPPPAAAESLRQEVGQLKAEAEEMQTRLAGMDETVAQENLEKRAIAEELGNCRTELSNSTREPRRCQGAQLLGWGLRSRWPCPGCSGPACAACLPRCCCCSPPPAAAPPSPPPAGTVADVSNELVTCKQYSEPLAAQLAEANTHLTQCEADLQHALSNNLAVASGR